MVTITLVMVPGRGMQTVTLENGSTVADLVSCKALHGRSIYIDGAAVTPECYASTCVPGGAEVFATGTVKGN